MNQIYDRLDDAALIARILQSEHAAFEPLLQRYWSSIMRLCQRLLGPTLEAEDVAQEAAIVAFFNLAQLQNPAHFGAWLHAIAANLARSSLRRHRPISLDALVKQGALVVLWPPSVPTPEATVLAREDHDVIVAALNTLSPANRDVAIGFFLDGYSYTELAELLGVPLSTIKGRVFKGRRHLQQTLASLAQTTLKPDHRQRKELQMLPPDSDLIEVMIDAIFARVMTEQRLVVLRARGVQPYVPIWIGGYEGDMIVFALEGRQMNRPMPHDLTLGLLGPTGAQIQRIVVNTIVDTTFFAEITLALGDQTHVIDARPSDALALAVRTGAPIYVSRSVFEKASVQSRTPTEPQEFSGLEVLHQGADSLGGAVAPALSTFVARTLRYLGDLARGESSEPFPLGQIDWAARFPVQEFLWNNQLLQAVQLAEGEEAAWLLTPPAVWTQVAMLAAQAITMEPDILRQRSPTPSSDRADESPTPMEQEG
jgi:RNA polymerase sigma factor (sigma-70 family)